MIEKLLTQLNDLQTFWKEFPETYRAGGCVLLGLALLWKASSQHTKDGRMFFVSGLLALFMLAYGATLFVGSNK